MMCVTRQYSPNKKALVNGNSWVKMSYILDIVLDRKTVENLTDYIETAKQAIETDSDRALDRALGNKTTLVYQWRTDRAFPSPEKMYQLADLCEENPAKALMQLDIWKAQASHQQELVEVYKGILRQLSHAA